MDIDGGNIDNTAIGASTASTGKFTSIGATGTVTIGGGGNEFTISEASDNITFKNTITDKDIMFNVKDGATDTEVMKMIGETSTVQIPIVDIDSGAIDGTTIGASVKAAGSFTTVTILSLIHI